jgi:hypothetical protein
MATVTALATAEILDALGVTVSFPIYVEFADTTTLATLNTWAAAYLDALDPIIDGQITSFTLKPALTLPGGLKSAPVATAEAERNGVFNFSQATVKYRDGLAVPTIADAVIANGKIDLTLTAITTFISFITTVTNGVTITSKFLYALQGLVDAFISFRKHRKAELRRSLEVG